MITAKDKKRKSIALCWLMFAVVAIAGCIQYARYIYICGSRVPIMDYFRWISTYGRPLQTGAISLWDFFNDVNEQVQPGALALSFFVLKKTGYDMWPMMVIGVVLLCVQAVVMGASVLLMCRGNMKSYLCGLLGAVAVFMLRLNLNQWELYNEPFEMTCAIRLMLFFGMFAYADCLFRRIFDLPLSKQIVSILLFSTVSAIISLTFSAAYFVGLLGAICLAGITVLIVHRMELRFTHLSWIVIWGATVLGVLLVYIGIMPPATMLSAELEQVHIGTRLWNLLLGVILYYGATIVPLTLAERMTEPYCIIGVLILAMGIHVTLLYFVSGAYKDSLFPIMLVSYSFIICIAVEIGRIESYGVNTMMSSRYCVESLVGVCGLVMMAVRLHSIDEGETHKYRLWVVMLSGAAIVGTLYCNSCEMKIAPYRAAYQENIKQIMLNIDEIEDGQLGICQANPEYVRDAVAFLRENNLSVFNNAR